MALDYTIDLEIDLPRDQMVALLDNPENLAKWQRGFVSMEHLEGEAGQPGAKSKLVYQMGKRTIEMTEIITRRDLPEAFDSIYEAKGVHNVVKNRFIEAGPDKTRWESDQRFEFKGFMKLIGFLMPGAFKKQSRKYMVDFKNFAEHGTDVRESA